MCKKYKVFHCFIKEFQSFYLWQPVYTVPNGTQWNPMVRPVEIQALFKEGAVTLNVNSISC